MRNLEQNKRAADEAARSTGRDYVIVSVNGGEPRLLSLPELFDLPESVEVELHHCTARLRIVGGLVSGITGPLDLDAVARQYVEHDAAYAFALKGEHQASRRVGPLDRRHHERSKLAKFFRDLFGLTPGLILFLAVSSLAGCTATDLTAPSGGHLEPGPCVLEQHTTYANGGATLTLREVCIDSWVD